MPQPDIVLVNRMKSLLVRLLRGKATAIESDEIYQWAYRIPENLALVKEIVCGGFVGSSLRKFPRVDEKVVCREIIEKISSLAPSPGRAPLASEG